MNNLYSYNQHNIQQGYDNVNNEQQQYYDEYGGEIDQQGYDQQGGYEQQEELEVPILQEGQWSEHSTIASPSMYDSRKSRDQVSHSVVSLQYDPYREVLWSGYESGRTSSYKVNTLTSHEWRSAEVDPIQRYSSFLSSGEKNCQIIPINEFVLSVGEKGIRMHSDGGMNIGKFKAPELCDDEAMGVSSSTGSFSCATLFRPPGQLMTSDDIGPTHIIAGTNSRFVHGYDLRMLNNIGAEPMVSFDTQAPTTCIQNSSSGLNIICGGSDGKIRLLDGRLRSQRIQHTLDAHSGPLLDMCVQPDGIMMMTCGLIGRAVNPHDKKSPVNYVADPLVRVFDLRMNRQLPSVSMSMSNPVFAKFIPSTNEHHRATPSIVLGGSSGIVQVCAINPERGMDQSNVQILYVPLTDRKDKVTSLAISSSGEFISAGTTNGHISQYSICKGYNQVEEGRFLYYS
jgi:WD40 repeat protein